MTDTRPHSDESGMAVMAYRMSALEQSVANVQSSLEKSVGVLGGQMTALQTTVIAFQQKLPESYTPRPEADERHKRVDDALEDVDRRIGDLQKAVDAKTTENRDRIVRMEDRVWAFVAAMIVMALGVLFAIFRSGLPNGV